MKIRCVAFGDSSEAFVENRFKDGLNIIYSSENNKGKTIVFQSMMYALGNTPKFPSSFDFQDKVFITEIEIGGKKYRFIRKKDFIVVFGLDDSSLFNGSLGDLRDYLVTIGFPLPNIYKNGRVHLIYPELFYQMFFIGQDERKTSTINCSGLYTKDDFYQMLYSMKGLGSSEVKSNISDVELGALKVTQSELRKELKVSRNRQYQASFVSFEARRKEIEDKIETLNQENKAITEIKKEINVQLRKKAKNESLLGELHSLHKSKALGDLVCGDCGSKNIVYKGSGDFQFSVSDDEGFASILSVVQGRILVCNDEIDRLNAECNTHTEKIRVLLSDPDISTESLVYFKEKIQGTNGIEVQLLDISKKIKDAEKINKENENKKNGDRLAEKNLIASLSNKMQVLYKEMDHEGNHLVFNDMFTTGGNIYSGAEESEFFLTKFYVLGKEVIPSFPIIIDSFREGELSSNKESFILGKFLSMNKQIILSATLKGQEKGKYESDSRLNSITYDANTTSHMLSTKYLSTFLAMLPKTFLL